MTKKIPIENLKTKQIYFYKFEDQRYSFKTREPNLETRNVFFFSYDWV